MYLCMSCFWTEILLMNTFLFESHIHGLNLLSLNTLLSDKWG